MSESISLENAVRWYREENAFSKDVVELQTKWDFVPLFVYGNHKANFSSEVWLKGTPVLGHGITQDQNYTLFLNKEYPEPLAMKLPGAATAKHLYGEVRLVTPHHIFDLDAQFEPGVFTKREKVWVVFANAHDRVFKLAECWVYLYIHDMFREKIIQGDINLMRPFVEQMNQKVAYMWLLSDDKPNRDRLERNLATMRQTERRM